MTLSYGHVKLQGRLEAHSSLVVSMSLAKNSFAKEERIEPTPSSFHHLSYPGHQHQPNLLTRTF